MTDINPQVLEELSHRNSLIADVIKRNPYEHISGNLDIDLIMIQRMYEENYDEELVEAGHHALENLSWLVNFQINDAFFSKKLNAVLLIGYSQADELKLAPVLLILHSSPSLGLSYVLFIPKEGAK